LPDHVSFPLLKLTKGKERLKVQELREQLSLSKDALEAEVCGLEGQGLLRRNEETIEIDKALRLRLAEQLIHTGADPRRISRFLKWQEFEDFAADSLRNNGYRVVKHLVFRSRSGRREVDIIAWNDNFVLTFDCKHWAKGLSPSRVMQAADAQAERAALLAGNEGLLARHGLQNPGKRKILPVVLSLGEPRQSIVNGVPIVPISKLMSFLYGISPVDETFRFIPIHDQAGQSSLV